jgi:O-antigen/teichoic acid export membrane protein
MWGFSIGNALAAGVSLAFLTSVCRQQAIVPSLPLDAAVWRKMLVVGGPALVAFLVVACALLVGQLVLAYQPHGYRQVAVFNVAYRWHLAILLLPGALATVLLPTMARLRAEGEDATSAALFKFNVRTVTGVSALGAVVLAAAATPLLALSGAYYSHHVAPLRVLMLAAVPGALNSVLSSASVSLGAIGAWLWSDVVLAAAFFSVAIILIPLVGATGLAIAYLTGYVATDLSLVRPVARRLRLAQART